LAWADVVFAMDEKHKSRLLAVYRDVIASKPMQVLDIPKSWIFFNNTHA
jgi:predicted protein tyrosine phosphatase